MTLKRWVLGKVNDAPHRGSSRVPPTMRGEPVEPTVAAPASVRDAEVTHLGPYGALIGAIREELEHFAAGPLRLHLAIAEGDRYVLTSIEVECESDEAQADLLRRFQKEFHPEQIKLYLARDVIAGLRNASAIDLSQFAGLNAVRPVAAAVDDDGYADLLAELQASAPEHEKPPFQVTLMGRWSSTAQRAGAPARARVEASPPTPTARAFALQIEDTAGARRIELAALVPGRRYCIGKDGGCDVVVDGTYASRRHCEIWYERGTWWAADAGSTNGIRVESNGRIVRADSRGPSGVPPRAVEWPTGAALVLSAHASGEAAQYPRVVVRPVGTDASDAPTAIQTDTPSTPIAPAIPVAGMWSLRVRMDTETREVRLAADALPFSIGRSRNQSLVVDRSLTAVSGHHVEIVSLGDEGAAVVVHGDNGIVIGDRTYDSGARVTWRADETLTLGRPTGEAASCAFTLARAQ
jgi:hypothetical protein